MAVLDKSRVTVLVNGQAATEYDDDKQEIYDAALDYPDVSTVSKYIEATSGSFFAFKIGVGRSYKRGKATGMIADTYVDGSLAHGCVVSLRSIRGRRQQAVVHGKDTTGDDGKPVLYKFQFANLETSKQSCYADYPC